MCIYLILQIFFTFNIVLVENFVTNSLPDSSFLSSLLPFDPKLLPNSAVPPCSGYEKSLQTVDLTNKIIQSRLFKIIPINPHLTPCENTTKILAEFVGGCGCRTEFGKCDTSYIAFILQKLDGKLLVVGQGIRLRDGSILTVFENTQYDIGDIWVEYSCKYWGTVRRKVICMKKPHQCSRNILSELVVTVQLVVEEECCTDCYFYEPEIQTCLDTRPVRGYFLTQSNCTSHDYCITPKLGVLLPYPTGLGVSIVIVDKPLELCLGYQGGVFVDDDCKVLGMAIAKPAIVPNTIFSVPLAKEINTECVILVIPIEL